MPAGSRNPQMFVGIGTPDGQEAIDDSADALKVIASGASGGTLALAEITVQSSQAVTSSGSANGTSFTNPGHRGALFFFNVSSRASSGGQSPTLDVRVHGQDPVSTNFFSLPGASFAQVTTSTSAQTLLVYPSAPASSGSSFRTVAAALPRTWRIQWVAENLDSGGGQPGTYEFTVGAIYIP